VPAYPGSPGQSAIKQVCVFVERDRLFKVTGSHVRCESDNISEMMHDRHVVATQVSCGLLTRAISNDLK